jgi:dCTP deaminase
MPFWTTQKLRRVLAGDDPPIVRPILDRANNACYELSLGAETFITSGSGTKQTHKGGDQIRIPPGQSALLITDEELIIPRNVLAFISIRASKKISGLVNISGFHVDPGFRGRLKFSVYNAGSESIILEVGERMFPIWFYQLDEDNEDEYRGNHQGQKHITPEDVMHLQGEMASPAALKKEIDELRAAITNWKAVTIAVLGGALASAISAAIAIMKH